MLKMKEESKRSAYQCSGSTLLLTQVPIRLLSVKRVPAIKTEQNGAVLVVTLSQVRNGPYEEHPDNCSKVGSILRECANIWELYPSHQRSCNKFHTVGSNRNCALGAVTAHPTSLLNNKAATCLSKTSRERYFVSASAEFASPWTKNNRKSPRRRPSWTNSCPTARCLTRPIPALLQIPTAAAESVCILSVMLKPRSRPTLWIPTLYCWKEITSNTEQGHEEPTLSRHPTLPKQLSSKLRRVS